MKGNSDAAKETAKSTSMSDFFRNASVEEKREAYRIVANEAIEMQKAVIESAKKLRSESCK